MRVDSRVESGYRRVGFGLILLVLIAGSMSVTSPALACMYWDPDAIVNPNNSIDSGGILVKSKGEKNGGGDSGTIECFMEEVVVYGHRINSNFWWLGDLSGHYHNNPLLNNGEGGPSTPVLPALEHPVNVGDDITCGSDEHDRRVHANRDIDLFLLGVPLWKRGRYLDEPISVGYNDGGRELWTIANPSLGSDHTMFNPPIGDSNGDSCFYPDP